MGEGEGGIGDRNGRFAVRDVDKDEDREDHKTDDEADDGEEGSIHFQAGSSESNDRSIYRSKDDRE